MNKEKIRAWADKRLNISNHFNIQILIDFQRELAQNLPELSEEDIPIWATALGSPSVFLKGAKAQLNKIKKELEG